jgi:SAM-dependent methyltransferase
VPLQRVFDDIYRRGKWATDANDAGTSGLGSTVESTYLYRMFLGRFFAEAKIHSVVDAGCGDWEFSQAIDWSGIDYKGYDIVPSVVEKDRAKFERPNVHFFQANVVEADLPPADLLIVKHVLQHLPNAMVQRFFAQLPKYKHVLMVDAVDPDTLSGKNTDIVPGDFRFFDPTAPPFNLNALKALTYWDGADMQQVVYVRPRR